MDLKIRLEKHRTTRRKYRILRVAINRYHNPSYRESREILPRKY